MRFLQKAALTGLLVVSMTSTCLASTVLFEWQGQGKSEIFTVASKFKSWHAAWECQPQTSPSIAILRANGSALDYLGASYKGEKVIAYTGKLRLDAGNVFCRVTATSAN